MRSGVGGRELRANWRVWERWALLGGHVQRAAGMSQVMRAEGGCCVQSAHRGDKIYRLRRANLGR